MRENLAASIKYAAQDMGRAVEDVAEVYGQFWRKHRLDSYPSGLDYFMFDSGLVCGFDNALRWLELTLGEHRFRLDDNQMAEIVHYWSSERAALAVNQVAFSRRRRHKTELDWVVNGEVKTNRVNRAVRRAISMSKTVELVTA